MKIHLTPFFYGGVDCATASALALEVAAAAQDPNVGLYLDPVGDDALISRSRSIALTRFLDSGSDVFFMLDHDIRFEAGTIAATCAKALAVDGVVGGLYACRGRKNGLSSRFVNPQVNWRPGLDELHEAEYVAGGFIAIPRRVAMATVERLSQESTNADLRLHRCLISTSGSYMWDAFRPFAIPSAMHKGTYEYLSEDWAFCRRAATCGEKLWIWSAVTLEHVGRHSFTLDQAQ